MAEQLSRELIDFIRPLVEPIEFVTIGVAGREMKCSCCCQGGLGAGSGSSSGKLALDLLRAQGIIRAESQEAKD